MTDSVTAIASPLGPLHLRPETAGDEPFRFALFCVSRPDLALLPAHAQAHLTRMQFKAQTMDYRARYPDARFEIVMLDGVPAGRLVRAVAGGALHLVEVAVTPSLRGRGIGTALLRALMEEARSAALSVRLQVAADNPGAERLYRRLGFSIVRRDHAYLEMDWKPD